MIRSQSLIQNEDERKELNPSEDRMELFQMSLDDLSQVARFGTELVKTGSN